MSIEIIDTRDGFQQIIKDFSATLYPQHPFPNLQCNETIDENFDKGFVLYINNKPAAMACVINNANFRFENEKTACIAFYECIENSEASHTLLHTICNYCKKQGYKHLVGPINGSTWNSYRFATETITDSFLSELFHKDYYVNQFEQFGFKTTAEYVTQIDTKLTIPKVSNDVNEDISFRTLDVENYEAEIKKIFAFCTEVFQNNFLYTAIDEATFLKKYKALKDLINPEFVLIAEHNGETVGLILALHDFYCKHEKRLIIKTLARKSSLYYVGVAQELSAKVVKTALLNNYQCILHAFMHQNNASKNVSRKFSGEPFRTYKLFQKEL
ncbi:MAG: hypothetical protein EOP00_28540 [Pedobacter sp.]|nr:MAG: hypothetical protein EOP00_28540 [Pedobacter sp.]